MDVSIAIPTRNRPGYLSVLLSSLLSQDYDSWDLMLFPNGPKDECDNALSGPVRNILRTIEAQGHDVRVFDMGYIGRSAAVAYNRAMLEARGDVVLCLDDDTWAPPSYLTGMVEAFKEAEAEDSCLVLSGVSPWMDPAWEGIGPKTVRDVPPDDVKMVEFVLADEHFDGRGRGFEIITRQNNRYPCAEYLPEPTLRPSDAINPINFMLRPELDLPWSDVGYPCTFSDLAWSIQLTDMGGYDIIYSLGTPIWHVNAVSGGLRLIEGNYDKSGEGRDAQMRRVERLLRNRTESA